MSIKGFEINGNIEKYDYESLDNKPDLNGGSAEEWEHVCDISVVEDTENPINKIVQDLGANYKKLNIFINKNSPGGLITSGSDSYPLRIYANMQTNYSSVAVFGQQVLSAGWSIYSAEIDYNAKTGLITCWSSTGFNAHFKTVNTGLQSPISKLIFTGNGFKTFTINIYGVKA